MKLTINNQKGFGTLMMVLMVGIFLLTSFTSLYVYIINRSKFQARIKESYNVINVMEQAAKVMKGRYDQILKGANGDPTAVADWGASWTNQLNTLNGSYTGQCAPANSGCAANEICIENVNNSSQPYCIPAGLMTKNDMELKRSNPIEIKETPQNRVKSFVAKLDRFFDRSEEKLQLPDYPYSIAKPGLVAWLLAESKAIAHDRDGGYHNNYPPAGEKPPATGGNNDTPPPVDNGGAHGNSFGTVVKCSAGVSANYCKQQCSMNGVQTGKTPCFKVQFCPHGEECGDQAGQTKTMTMTFSFVNSSM